MKDLKDYLHEEWRNVHGYAREYLVSSVGRIKGRRRPSYGSMTDRGYMRGALWTGLKFSYVMVHRLVAIAFIPNPDNKPHVNHKNGIKSDNRIENLEWCTVSENALHAYSNGLRVAHPPVGESHPGSKLKESDIKQIRISILSEKELSKRFGVSHGVIHRIKKYRTWKHVA